MKRACRDGDGVVEARGNVRLIIVIVASPSVGSAVLLEKNGMVIAGGEADGIRDVRHMVPGTGHAVAPLNDVSFAGDIDVPGSICGARVVSDCEFVRTRVGV